jgi:hypothetical protein
MFQPIKTVETVLADPTNVAILLYSCAHIDNTGVVKKVSIKVAIK